ncbi:hypothetical protein [Bacillus infantis]|uniref:Uncharacterized protein n=1 Tax=Bacillus infantis TaxID=324767 RepID=A0A5D4R2C8_9BACI|nr:hypothetical protein [Bacillus infantis]TYS44164.1 hypothetical protein FZD51_21715 [Bacillus infantis]
MNTLKQLLLFTALGGQLLGLAMIFISLKAAVLFYASYAIFIIALLIMVGWERNKEKKEENEHDYRHY